MIVYHYLVLNGNNKLDLPVIDTKEEYQKHKHLFDAVDVKGQHYSGSERELLSEFMGGVVGFAYLHTPSKDDLGGTTQLWEVELHPKTPVILSLNGENVPRRDFKNWTFEEQLMGVPCPNDSSFIGKYFIGVASELNKFKDCEELGELVFLANDNAVFHHRIA